MDRVWILIIDNNHGSDVSVHASHECAMQSLYKYCSDEWDDGLDEQYGTLKELSRGETIDAYFDAWNVSLNWEWYLLEEREIKNI